MQQRAGAGGSDVFVGQILNIVLSELCALHNRQMLKQLSHVATLILLQQHQYNLQKQLIVIYHLNLSCRGCRVLTRQSCDLLDVVVTKLNVCSGSKYMTLLRTIFA